MRQAAAALALFCALAAACAPQAQRLNSAAISAAKPVWSFEASDLPVEPEYRFGRLPNGMRYVVRHNAYPKGTVLVRMDVAAGSLDEAEDERGFAHFVEHMAFNGSTRVPEGEMVRLLERDGLVFGADTNASTSFQATTYKLDLPGNRAGLIDTALMLMRETASELTFSPTAVDRERGVVLSEMRDRNNYALRNAREQAAFLHPHALYPRRFPIGAAETVATATSEALKAFWRREYVPSATTVVVVGDIDAGEVEAMIARRFGDWQGPPGAPQPDAGPVDIRRAGKAAVHIDQALSERVVASRHGRRLNEPDTAANRRENVLRQIGYAIINRRLERISRQPAPPFRDAGFGTGEVFRSGRTTNLVVDTVDGKWQPGLVAAAGELRRALRHGFTEAEVAEQVAILRRAAINAAASAGTRGNAAYVNAITALLRDDRVPTAPQGALARLEALIPEITPRSVREALQREAVRLDKPLIRFQGRRLPSGGEKALLRTWAEADGQSPGEAPARTATAFAYTSFGEPAALIADEREPMLGIRRLRFANGVRLNLKRTDLQKDVVLAQVTLDGGDRLATKDNPLAVQMIPMFVAGGLGKHSLDELQTILAGHTIGTGLSSRADAFVAGARTTPEDLELQMQVFAAFVTDPGYRPEGELRYRLDINNYFLRKNATPGSALAAEIGGILSDGDPRFSLQGVDDYRKLTFAKLKGDLADRLSNGAIEIGIVGDFDEDAAIAMVARTFGALPPRETAFRPMAGEPPRLFTGKRTRRVIRHDGPADQALIQFVWPTRDDSDAMEAGALRLLERIVRIELIETLREKLGKAYSPGASSAPSRYWKGYGTFSLSASVDVRDLAATRAAILETIGKLRAAPVSADVLQRARQPLLESHDNALKTNGGWLLLVDRAQSESDRIGRYLMGKDRLLAVTPDYLALLAGRTLDPAQTVEIDVLPRSFTEPAN